MEVHSDAGRVKSFDGHQENGPETGHGGRCQFAVSLVPRGRQIPNDVPCNRYDQEQCETVFNAGPERVQRAIPELKNDADGCFQQRQLHDPVNVRLNGMPKSGDEILRRDTVLSFCPDFRRSGASMARPAEMRILNRHRSHMDDRWALTRSKPNRLNNGSTNTTEKGDGALRRL
ncbi:hypothetical protein [Hartmannibacter diazotrophicus]|uniref:hypothetical protein n=1 Tax=Hartmannibacter diazotrophicus TaxID=1482074 RepID=UPI001390328F|nr:hypothetical protein [Hartmannibacter diazotrophicus]